MSDLHGIIPRHEALVAERLRITDALGLEEGASTRLLVNAGKLVQAGVAPAVACDTAVAHALTDDPELLQTIHELASAVF